MGFDGPSSVLVLGMGRSLLSVWWRRILCSGRRDEGTEDGVSVMAAPAIEPAPPSAVAGIPIAARLAQLGIYQIAPGAAPAWVPSEFGPMTGLSVGPTSELCTLQ